MRSHVDTKHATAAKLGSNDSDGQQFLAGIVVSYVEKKGVDALLRNDLKRRGGEVSARTSQVSVRDKKMGGTLIEDRKGNEGSRGGVSNFSKSGSEFDSDVESDEE